MTGNLDNALRTLLTSGLPNLLGGASPPVSLRIASDLFEMAAESHDAMASEPRPDDREEILSFDPNKPEGPYLLAQPPYPGPRRLSLVTAIGDRLALRESEVVWDEIEARKFTLALRPNRELAGVNRVLVLYGVTAIFTKLKARQTVTVQLESGDNGKLDQAESLAIAVMTLNREPLMQAARAAYQDGDYGAEVEIKSFKLVKGASLANNARALTLQVDLELKATRALRDDEGKPIERIRTPGRPLVPERKVDIQIDVEA